MFGFRSKGYKYGNTRRFVRLPAAWPMRYETQTEGANPQVTHTADVSAGGVAVTVRERLPVGSRIKLKIHVPPMDRSFDLVGKVVRCLPLRKGGFDVGIQFEQIQPEDQKMLNDAIENFYTPHQRTRQLSAAWWRKIT